MTRSPLIALVCASLLLLAACGSETPATDTQAEVPSGAPASMLLKAEPAGKVSVLDAKAKAEGDEVVVVGRVSDIVKGFAAFSITDASVAYCGQGSAQCGCPTPWDYCCEEEKAKAGRLPVEFRDAKGEPVESDGKDLRLLDLVVVKGTLEKTESGGLLIVATNGWFRAERPKLPDGLEWPE